jgi:hypothetical protein
METMLMIDSDELEQVAEFLDGEGLLYQVQVDTLPPTTNVVLGEFDEDRWAGQNLAKNGDFEGPDYSDWVGQGQGDHTVVGPEFAHSGDHAFRIGFKDNSPTQGAQDRVYQMIAIPEKLSASLSFWYQVLSDDTVDYDWFSAEIRDENNYVLERILATGSDELGGDDWTGDSGWREVTRSLLGYSGRTIKIWFEVTNNDAEGSQVRTWAHIDDVVISTVDNQLSSERDVDLDTHDTGSGVDETNIAPDPVDYGENTLEYNSVDFAENQEATKTADINVLPDVVLNKFVASPAGPDQGTVGIPLDGEWIELFNNSDSDVNVEGWYLYDANDSHALQITAANIDTDGDLSDSDDLPVIPARGWLRVYRNGDADFSLNSDSGGDTLRLYDDEISIGNLIDKFEYRGPVGEDQVWQRNPDGIGSWELVKPSWDYDLKYTNGGQKIWLTIYNLPDDLQSVEYEITYQSGGIDRGIAGTITPDSVVENKADRQFVLGVCSAHGTCVYDTIDSDHFHLELILTTGSGSETKIKEFDL